VLCILKMEKEKKSSKRADSAPLETIRAMVKEQSIPLEPIANQVSALPSEPDLEYYFIPLQYMKDYKAYSRPNGSPFKNLKLVNFDRPAISLSFFFKHKYVIKRAPRAEDVLLHLKNFRDDLMDQSLFKQFTNEQLKDLRKADEVLRALRDNPSAFEACFSNYHHYYRYWYCAYRYFEDDTENKANTLSEHLLKHTERVKGKVHERLNIIFIDPKYITRPVPNDNKRIDRELDTFSIQFKQGVTTLYLRKASH
jgi:hypothetical protein